MGRLSKVVEAAKEIKESVLSPEVLRLKIKQRLNRAPLSEKELAISLDCSPERIHSALVSMRRDGANLKLVQGEKYVLVGSVEAGGQFSLKAKDRGDGWTVFGFITDHHLGNRHERLDVINRAYQTFKEEGITDVFDAGNMIDGEARFNKNELKIFGMENQVDYWIEKIPQIKGITTHYITGDDHEGWYNQRECINVGSFMQMKAEKAGRKDLHYLAHVEADISLRCGKGEAVARLAHPGGGSSYAMSYAPQKIVESYQGGEKPALLMIGHYHKFDYCFPREIHVISGGCTEDQTLFMRKKKLAAHVGFSIIKLKQDSYDGHITRLGVEWNPFFDRGYYERNFE